MLQENSFQLKINSIPDEISKVEKLLEKIIEQYHIDDDTGYNIAIAVTEAVNNAILHGNQSIESKVVKLTLEIKNSTIHVRVEDEGDGFEPQEVPDPLDPENLMKASGRGIFIVKQMMENVEIISSSSGTTIKMEKKL